MALPAHLAPYARPGVGAQGPQGTPQAPPMPQQTAQNLSEALAGDYRPRAGAAQNEEHSTSCPNCYGASYFEVVGAGATVFNHNGQKVHSMQCTDCGYPVVQAGSRGGALGSAAGTGPARAARQYEPGRPVEVDGVPQSPLSASPDVIRHQQNQRR